MDPIINNCPEPQGLYAPDIPKPEAEANSPPEREVLTRLEGFQNVVVILRKMPSVNDRELVIRSVAAFYGLTVE